MSHHMTITIIDEGADADLLEQESSSLRRELLELGIDDVAPVNTGPAPEGARGADAALIGMLSVIFQGALPVVTGIVGVISTWLGAARGGRAVELTIGDKTLKLDSATKQERERLVDEFVAALRRQDEQSATGVSTTA